MRRNKGNVMWNEKERNVMHVALYRYVSLYLMIYKIMMMMMISNAILFYLMYNFISHSFIITMDQPMEGLIDWWLDSSVLLDI
jgi:hypothetical protein